jgi:hypothetical protein
VLDFFGRARLLGVGFAFDQSSPPSQHALQPA